jgi:cellobiose phosphorylase
MKFGYFDNQNKEYVITTPKTPMKWINYIGGLDFGGFIDQTGGALLCKGDPALNRITKYIPQLPGSEFNGTTLYLRIKDKKGYHLISPLFTPTLNDYTSYECRVGLGYSKFTTVVDGFKTEILVFVPLEGGREIRDITITNLNDTTVEIDIVPLVEYTHFEAMKQFNNADWVPQTMMSELLMDEEGIEVVKQYAFMKKGIAENFFTASMKCESFETDRERFLGEYGYGSYKDPISLQTKFLSNYLALRGNNMFAGVYPMGECSKNKPVRLITQLGQFEKDVDGLLDIYKYRDIAEVEKSFELLKDKWTSYTERFIVETPDKDFDTLVNIYNPRQCMITKNWSRFLSLYQLGLGARGIGFRDTSQDLLGAIGIAPDETTDMIEKLLSTQRIGGNAMHQFFPLTMEATNGDSAEMEDRHDYYGDDHLWIILTICQYVKESGDLTFLEKVIPYYEKDKLGNPKDSGTVLDHMLRSLNFTKTNVGAHGLPYLGFADWNDTVNLPIGSESVFNANLYGKSLREMIQLAEKMGDITLKVQLEADYEVMKTAVNDSCWDGKWYVRYFDQKGEPIGSHKNQEGKIFTNAQSWSIMSGFCEGERATMALDSVHEYLATKNGIKLSFPGYNGYDPEKGGVSTYPPGAKENGGIFLHSNPWVIIAETMLGHGDRAYSYHKRINPVTKNNNIESFEVEPYVFPQNILGDEHPQFGLARNSWLSGTASWMYQAATNYIIGVQADYDGLVLDPCIPKEWDTFKVTKRIKGDTYHITFTNPQQVEKGIRAIEVDGVAVNTSLIPYALDGKEHYIHAIMG